LTLETKQNRKDWISATLFAALWAEAIQRDGHIWPCKPTVADLKAAFRYFKENPAADVGFTVATAFNAWRSGNADIKPNGFDPVFHCRKCLEIQSFLRLMAAGKIMAQIGGLGWKINAWTDLRWVFTISELSYYGFKIPIAAQDPEDLWENCEAAPDYYRNFEARQAPPESALLMPKTSRVTSDLLHFGLERISNF
jgi:hypothetical protein